MKNISSPNVSSTEKAAFFVTCLAMTQAIWVIGFNFGAYNDVFFEHLFMIWVASITALLARLFIGKPENASEHKQYFGWQGACLLILPTIWIITEVITLNQTNSGVQWLRLILTLLTISIALPYIGYIIVHATLPKISKIQHPRLKIGLVSICLFVAVLAYWIGANNDYVMTCHDFSIAGASLPTNCFQENTASLIPQ
jgi:Kef-type K+ transport system membrane component KefB